MTDFYRFLVVGFLLAANAFFAAAEVALLSVRRSRLRELVEEGHVGAQAASSLLANPERLLSVVQVGVTLASLGLGWAGEGTLYGFLVSQFDRPPGVAAQNILHWVCLVASFLVISFAHVVLGEVVPKNLAMEKADRLAMLVAPVLLVFYRISEPFVWVIERSAAAVSRLLGVRAEHLGGGGHSPEELKFIISSSRRHGHLDRFEEDAIQRLLDLQDHVVREVMIPRNDIVSVSVDSDLDGLLALMSEHRYTRVPVWERAPEHILGFVHHKDLLEVWHQRRIADENHRPAPPFHLRRLLREAPLVPESKPLDQMVDEFRKSHTHMALVVDEFGTIVGLITLEDVFEQVFGEIEDEHDAQRPPPPAAWDVLELEGTVSILDLETQYEIELPANAGFETLAGFLLFRLGYIPAEGDAVEFGGRRFTVLTMERNRIARVRVERISPGEEPGANTG